MVKISLAKICMALMVVLVMAMMMAAMIGTECAEARTLPRGHDVSRFLGAHYEQFSQEKHFIGVIRV